MKGVITMFSAAEITRPGSSETDTKLVKRIPSKGQELKYTEQLLEDGMCGS